jgi:hypothetical protein
MMKKLLLLPLLTLVGCAGYTLGPTKPAHLSEVTKIAVPTFENETLEPRLAVLVTNAVIKQLQVDGTYQIVNRDQADAVLEAKISDVDKSQWRAVRNNTLRTSELLVRLRTDYKLKDSAGTALHQGRVLGESYLVIDPNWQLSEHQAMEEAAQRIAATLVSEIADGW